MIDAITNIPDEVLKGQLEESLGKCKENEIFLIVFLNENFEISEIKKGTYKEICENNNLSKLQKNLIKQFNYYRGISSAPKDFNRYSFGGKQSLATCSLLHFDFSKKEGKTRKNLFDEKIDKNIQNILKSLGDEKRVECTLSNEYCEIKVAFKEILDNLFINKILKDDGDVSDFKKYKIVLIPSSDAFIEDYNLFFKKFMDIRLKKQEGNKQKFNLDTFKSNQVGELGALYSKFFDKKIIFQTEENNQITTKDYGKIQDFKIILNSKHNILPLPMFNVGNMKNVYNICFSNVLLLDKLKEIYKEVNDKPFNYVLISNFDGYRFENIVNFNFKINDLINEGIFNLKFNDYNNKDEFKQIMFNREHNKYELFFDIAFLFWRLGREEYSNKRQMSFFNPEIKENHFLDQLLKENSDAIINQIFKQNNDFINFRFMKLIDKLLLNILAGGEIQERYLVLGEIKKLLLIALKYETKKGELLMVEKVKIIEDKIEKFKTGASINLLENDFEGYFWAGQIMYYLVKQSSSSKNGLELMGKYMLSINNVEQLKNKICFLTQKYSHNIYERKEWQIINKEFLSYVFQDMNIKDNLIPIFIGFYSKNIFYSSNGDKNDKNEGDKNEQ